MLTKFLHANYVNHLCYVWTDSEDLKGSTRPVKAGELFPALRFSKNKWPFLYQRTHWPFLYQRTHYPSRRIIRPQSFYTGDALSVWTNLGKHLFFVSLSVSGIKTGTRRIIRLDELSFEIRLERRTKSKYSSRRIIRLVPIFILKTHNQTNYKCLPKFVRTDNASLV